MDRSFRQKINKETVALNDILDQIDLVDIFRTFHCKAVECTVFTSACETLSRIDHKLGHKTSLNKFKMIEVLSNSLSYHNGMGLEITYRKKTEEHTNIMRLTNRLLKDEWVNNEIKGEFKKYLEANKNEKNNNP